MPSTAFGLSSCSGEVSEGLLQTLQNWLLRKAFKGVLWNCLGPTKSSRGVSKGTPDRSPFGTLKVGLWPRWGPSETHSKTESKRALENHLFFAAHPRLLNGPKGRETRSVSDEVSPFKTSDQKPEFFLFPEKLQKRNGFLDRFSVTKKPQFLTPKELVRLRAVGGARRRATRLL